MDQTVLSAAQRDSLRALAGYGVFIWVTRIWIIAIVATIALFLAGGGGQIGLGALCLLCVAGVIFAGVRRNVVAQMERVIHAPSRHARSNLSLAIWRQTLRDAFRAGRS